MDRTGKLYYSIAEVAQMAGVKAHVLRYWETEFPSLRPKKNRAGNRTYRERDVKIVLLIKRLLYDEGFTIRGALKRLRERKNEEIEQIEIPFLSGMPLSPEEDLGEEVSVVTATGAEPSGNGVSSAEFGRKQAEIKALRRELESLLSDLSS